MATKETKDGLGYIIQAITNIIEPKVADLRYDKTYRAKVTGKRDIGIYNVEINRIEYQLNYSGNLEIGDIVRVKAPLNNFSDIYIETVPGSGGGSGGTENYNDLINKPVLNTNNTTGQNVSSNEIIKGTISLHKIAKTGDYNDLNNKPSLKFIPISDKGVADGVATLGTDSKVVSEQLPIASNSVLGAIKVGTNLTITNTGVLNNSISVIDNLESESTTNALSANQGKILKGYITDNDTMITTLQEDVINIEDNITKIKANYIPTSQKGNANGVATLGVDVKVPDSQLPIASDSKLGVIKVGANLSIGADGTLNAVGGGTGGVINETVIGSIALYAGEKIPDGWLICNGQIVYSKDYPDLYKVIGNTYGGTGVSGDFQVPDLRDRIPLGLNNDAGGLTDFIGNKGGSATHTHTLNNAYGNMYIGSEYMYYNRKQNVTNNTTIRKSVSGGYGENARTWNKSDITLGGTTDSESNMPPYIKLNYIIKAKETNAVIASVEDTLTSDSTKNALSAKQGKVLDGMITTLGTYSTNEINTGKKWIDGKPIYRKVISCGTLPNATSKLVNHNISNIDNSRVYGFAVRTSDKREFPLPFSSADGNGNIQLDLTSTQIQIASNIDRSSFNTSYVILEYTKTTD